ncbi:MAG: alpha-amylase family glycosyl hydrolase, partial [Planctomycetaceae bacterium]
CWYADVEQAQVGDEYRYYIYNGKQKIWRIDPYAREVTNSVGNAVVHQPHFDWQGDEFQMPPWNELVVYELHIGTFADRSDGRPDDLADVARRLRYLAKLGVNAIELMPAAEFAGDRSWGYNPAHIFAVESAYGGPNGLKTFVRAAHDNGLAVILDVVYNHFGPSDLSLWQFDGWSEHDGGGIYFYNDHRRRTPWGDTRPDYGREQVRRYIRDNVLMWLEDYHVDGLRFDMTQYVRTIGMGDHPGEQIADGWRLLRDLNREINERYPGRISIAEDLQNEPGLTHDDGAAFDAQWDAKFVHPIRHAIITHRDEDRSMHAVREALEHRYNGDVFERVIYTESHDEVANGKSRVPSEIMRDNADSWFAQKRSTL